MNAVWRLFVCTHPAYGAPRGVMLWANASNRAAAITLFGRTVSFGLVRRAR